MGRQGGEVGVKILKNEETSFMDDPLFQIALVDYHNFFYLMYIEFVVGSSKCMLR